MKPYRSLAASFVGVSLLAASLSAEATTVMMESFVGNDCGTNGVFTPMGSGLDACRVFYDPNDYDSADESSYVVLSPVIAKFDTDNDNLNIGGGPDDIDIATMWPSVDGDEWTFTGDNADESKVGTWSYTKDPGEDDPSIRYWTTKSANGFTLYWEVDAASAAGPCAMSVFSLSCLQAAQSLNGGSWDLDKGLSHLTFFDSEDPSVIPLPAASWLLISAIAALFMVVRPSRQKNYRGPDLLRPELAVRSKGLKC